MTSQWVAFKRLSFLVLCDAVFYFKCLEERHKDNLFLWECFCLIIVWCVMHWWSMNSMWFKHSLLWPSTLMYVAQGMDCHSDSYSSCGSSELPWFVFQLVWYLRGGRKTEQGAGPKKGREILLGVLHGSRNQVSLVNCIKSGCLWLSAGLKNKLPSRISHTF